MEEKKRKREIELDLNKTKEFITKEWDESIIPALIEYVKIPNQSPAYDDQWETNGELDKALNLIIEWIKKQNLKGSKLEVIKEKGRTPLLFITCDATPLSSPLLPTTLIYGHFDKQPPLFEEWEEA